MNETELTKFRLLQEQRLAKVKEKINAVFNFKETDSPPFLVAGAYDSLFGQLPESIPENYYDDPEVMTRFQEDNYFRQMLEIDDDFLNKDYMEKLEIIESLIAEKYQTNNLVEND